VARSAKQAKKRGKSAAKKRRKKVALQLRGRQTSDQVAVFERMSRKVGNKKKKKKKEIASGPGKK